MVLNEVNQVNERALLNVRTSKSARGDLKQVLQSREELYGASLDPGWFKRGYSLGTKAKSTNQRNKARLLAAAALTVAQMGSWDIRENMVSGDSNVLKGMKLTTIGTAAQFIKALGKASPMEILNLCKPGLGAWLGEAFLQQADDFDFILKVLTVTGDYPELNPTLGAVNDAFMRRKVRGCSLST